MRRLGVAIAAAAMLSAGSASATEVDTFVIDFYNGTSGVTFNANGTVNSFGNSTVFGDETVEGTLKSGAWGAGTYLIDPSDAAASGSITDAAADATAGNTSTAWTLLANGNFGGSPSYTSVGSNQTRSPKSYLQQYDDVVTVTGTTGVTGSNAYSGIEFDTPAKSGSYYGSGNTTAYFRISSAGVLTYGTNTVNDLTVLITDVTPNPDPPPSVPEPVTMALFATALVGFGVARRKAA